MSQPMRFAVARELCRALGFTLVNDREWNQYIVKPAGARKDDPRNHFTDDLEDAVGTARAMHAHEVCRLMRDAAQPPV